ncbi:hypothetical protein EDC63_10848 [Sulfurirhabdus autotrophica]|uniref:Uncharacterized protein n=1 Tax=Sulfurirhabdus autotrophica TaxID=1706046 RepID=A0A4R3Y2C1_9PROT|nr:hypothetical protein EDC63_10848 [Sulfurirhabdus autotrophica]
MKRTSPSRESDEGVANGIKNAKMECAVFINHHEGNVINIMAAGIDLAKNILVVHGVDESGKASLVKPKATRDQLLPVIANLTSYLISMKPALVRTATNWLKSG